MAVACAVPPVGQAQCWTLQAYSLIGPYKSLGGSYSCPLVSEAWFRIMVGTNYVGARVPCIKRKYPPYLSSQDDF